MAAGSADHALAIDVGTQSVRAILFDPAGNLVAMGRVPVEPYVSPQPGWAEQDPEVWWAAIGEACRRLWASDITGGGGRPAPARVGGVALTTQRVTLVVADEDNVPLRPAIVWLDQRRTEGLAPVGGPWGLLFRLGGVRETVARFQADAEANWIERNEPSNPAPLLIRRAQRLMGKSFLEIIRDLAPAGIDQIENIAGNSDT